jgi:hypothetical protein
MYIYIDIYIYIYIYIYVYVYICGVTIVCGSDAISRQIITTQTEPPTPRQDRA